MTSIFRHLALLAIAGSAHAAVVSFEAADFGLNTTFSSVRTFSFEIDIADPLAPGRTFDNPTMNGVDYDCLVSLLPRLLGFLRSVLSARLQEPSFMTKEVHWSSRFSGEPIFLMGFRSQSWKERGRSVVSMDARSIPGGIIRRSWS